MAQCHTFRMSLLQKSFHPFRRNYNTLEVSIVNKIKLIKFNRIDKKNAMSKEMYREISNEMLASTIDSDIRAILFTGLGDFYSAGNDISNFQIALKSNAKAGNYDDLRQFVDAFIDFPKPIISAVNGPAIGIAVTTLGLCDRVFASTSSYFMTPFAALGLTPEGCSTYTFPKLMGESLTHEVLYNNYKLTAEEALACQLVHELYPPDALLSAAMSYCTHLESQSHQSILNNRYIIRHNLQEKLKAVNQKECHELDRRLNEETYRQILINYLNNLGKKR
mmetsp:Transcript_36734/g.37387  ORF Transcript_36734/g.37387 Transcript_36734/m.37387 type:complete len:278 (+) Transcript_36734:40-873(+)